eukprot:m.105064 g.105064  ORF g.105064 m.105064 type:complete len:448 (-) comp8908_c0_seq3:390-1733(-)
MVLSLGQPSRCPAGGCQAGRGPGVSLASLASLASSAPESAGVGRARGLRGTAVALVVVVSARTVRARFELDDAAAAIRGRVGPRGLVIGKAVIVIVIISKPVMRVQPWGTRLIAPWCARTVSTIVPTVPPGYHTAGITSINGTNTMTHRSATDRRRPLRSAGTMLRLLVLVLRLLAADNRDDAGPVARAVAAVAIRGWCRGGIATSALSSLVFVRRCGLPLATVVLAVAGRNALGVPLAVLDATIADNSAAVVFRGDDHGGQSVVHRLLDAFMDEVALATTIAAISRACYPGRNQLVLLLELSQGISIHQGRVLAPEVRACPVEVALHGTARAPHAPPHARQPAREGAVAGAVAVEAQLAGARARDVPELATQVAGLPFPFVGAVARKMPRLVAVVAAHVGHVAREVVPPSSRCCLLVLLDEPIVSREGSGALWLAVAIACVDLAVA